MKFHFRTATRVFFRTLPFVLLRMGVGAALGLATIVYFGLTAGVGYYLLNAGTISSGIAIVGLLVAIVLFIGLWRLLVRYVLYVIKAGHIAVIAHIIDTGESPPNQLRFGTGQVTSRFTETSALFALDQLVKSVIRQFNNRVVSVSRMLSFSSALRSLTQILGRTVAIAASYIDEAVLAYMFTKDESNPWRAARDGVVLYGKNWKPVLGSTLVIVLALYSLTFALLLALSPLAIVIGNVSPTVEAIGWVFVAGIALTVYTGMLKPWIKTVVITTFLIESANDTPDMDTLRAIESRSKKFSELTRRAEMEDTNSTTTDQQTAIADSNVTTEST